MSEQNARDNIPLNILRLVAAWLVVAGHVRALLFEPYSESSRGIGSGIFYLATSVGHQAVVVFFVLSGFWVGGGVIRRRRIGQFSWLDYSIDRGVRLSLVLWPAVLVTATLDAVGRKFYGSADVYTADYPYAGIVEERSTFDLWEFGGNLVYLQDLAVSPIGSNQALWSISYEFWFYALFPLLILRSRRSNAVLVILAVSISALNPVLLAYMPVWALGVVAWRVVDSDSLSFIGRCPWGVAAFVTAIFAVGASILSAPVILEDYILGILAAVLVATLARSPAAAVAGKTHGVGPLAAWMNARSHESYSLYAVHLPIAILTTAVVAPHASERWSSGEMNLVWLVGILLLLGVCAHLFAAATEGQTDRLRRGLKNSLRSADAWFVRGRGD